MNIPNAKVILSGAVETLTIILRQFQGDLSTQSQRDLQTIVNYYEARSKNEEPKQTEDQIFHVKANNSFFEDYPKKTTYIIMAMLLCINNIVSFSENLQTDDDARLRYCFEDLDFFALENPNGFRGLQNFLATEYQKENFDGLQAAIRNNQENISVIFNIQPNDLSTTR